MRHSSSFPALLLAALSLGLINTRSLSGQDVRAVGEMTGFLQMEAQPGLPFEFVPLFYPAASAYGPVDAVTTAHGQRLAKVTWKQVQDTLPDVATSFIWPLNGALVGMPLRHQSPEPPDTDPYDFWTQRWVYTRADGRPHTGFLLATAHRLSLLPYPLMEELVGEASGWDAGTTFTFAGRSALVSDENSVRVWRVGGLVGPGLVVDEALLPCVITVPQTSTSPVRWSYQGMLPLTMTGTAIPTRPFLVVPGQRMPLFRPDGAEVHPLFMAGGKLNLAPTGSPALIMATSLTTTSVAGADKVHFQHQQTGLEQTWFFKSGTTGGAAGWYRLPASGLPERVSDSEVAEVGLRSGQPIYITRATGKTQAEWRLPQQPNTFTAAALLTVPATSTDGDRTPDFWESLYFSNMTVSAVKDAVDADFDGFSNLAEFYLGGNPAAADHPAKLSVTAFSQPTGSGLAESFQMSFQAAKGMRYRIETRLGGMAAWTPAATGIVGAGTSVSYVWPVPTEEIGNRSARYFRVVALGPQDTDADDLYDVEEEFLGTDPVNPDTDGDGMNDGAEVRASRSRVKRNPLDYWDHAVFKFVVTGDRQVGASDTWCRDPVKITVTRTLPGSTALVPLPKNLSVNFVLTRGTAGLAADMASVSPSPVLLDKKLTLSADLKTGTAECYVKFGAADPLTVDVFRPIQGLVSVRVDSDPLNSKLYNESFLLYPSAHLTPPSGLVSWLRAESTTTLVGDRVTRWGAAGAGAGAMVGYDSPSITTDAAGRKWLSFSGAEALLLDDMIPPSGAYSLFLNSKSPSARTASVLATSTPSDAGARGQFFVISGGLPAGTGGLPTPYDDTAYRSYGLSLGAASVGLFSVGAQPLLNSPSLIASLACAGSGVDGVLLGLVAPAGSAPALFRPTGRAGVAAQWVVSPTAPHYLPRMIGGRAGGALSASLGMGMFAGQIRDLLLFSRNLTHPEAQRVEDIINSGKAVFVAAGYKALIPAINRDPGTPASDTLPDWWERSHWGNLSPVNAADDDSDGTNNLSEYTQGLHPRMNDTDGDGLSDTFEVSTANGKPATSPASWDTDNDLIPDNVDKLPTNPANGLSNTDGTGAADGWDWLIKNAGAGTDSDGDGLSDLFEVAWLGTDATRANIIDADGDGIPDHWEALYFANLVPAYDPGFNEDGTPTSYPDGDGITDLDEYLLGLNPRQNDFQVGSLTTGLQTQTVQMDDQGRVKAVGDENDPKRRTWSYDPEGNIIQRD